MAQHYEAVIGLEIHAQLLTETKIFCGCSTKFGGAPNTNVCPVCLGHPGVLPVLNKKAVEFAMLMGMATECTVNEFSEFARKNYFYPDLPKGYQISQYDLPICESGKIHIVKKDGCKKEIGITRIHLEEDAGKSIHDQSADTHVDVNRCGVPLIEIVSEPDMRTAEEAFLYLTKLKQILQYLGICDGNMEEGSLRCDANISIRPKGNVELGTKTEVKNMNSFHNVEKAITREIERQIDLVEEGRRVIQQTLLWDADAGEVLPMRSKEEAHDYRYFPDPDLIPVVISPEWKKEIEEALPELPEAKRKRLPQEYGITEYDAEVISQSKPVADYYEAVVKITDDYKTAANWIMGDVLKVLNEEKIEIDRFIITPVNLGEMINLIKDGTISGKIAKEVYAEMLKKNQPPAEIIKEKNLVQITDTDAIGGIIDSVLDSNAAQVAEYLAGKEKVLGFFVGQIMRETKGKANPQVVNSLLIEKLEAKR